MIMIEAIKASAETKETKEVDMSGMSSEQMLETVQKLMAELEALKKAPAIVTVAGTTQRVVAGKKNQVPGKPNPNTRYVLLQKELDLTIKAPQQQRDIAQILTKGMKLGEWYTEADVFNMLVDGCGDYESLYKANQDVTYLFRYYRGIKNDKYLGYIGRQFLHMVKV